MADVVVPPEVEFCLELGRCLQGLGTPAHRFEATMRRVCRRFGLEGQFFALPTGFLASLSGPGFHRSAVERAPNGDVNLDKLTQLHWITEGVLEGRFGTPEATEALRLLMAAPPRYDRKLQVLAYAAASGTAAQFFGGGLRAMALAGGLGLLTGLLAVFAARRPSLAAAFPLIAAAVVAFLSTLAARWIPGLPPLGVTLAGLIVLVPGLGLLIGMNELATHNWVAGTARLAGVGMVFLELGFGVVLGQRLGSSWVGALPAPILALPLWSLLPALAVWGTAFLVIFQGRRDDLGWVLAACALGFGAARLGAAAYGPEFGAGLGAFLLGSGSTLLSRLRNRPPWTTLLPGIMLLLPGSFAVRSLDQVMQRELLTGLGTAVEMVSLALSMLGGLLLANLLGRRSDPM